MGAYVLVLGPVVGMVVEQAVGALVVAERVAVVPAVAESVVGVPAVAEAVLVRVDPTAERLFPFLAQGVSSELAGESVCQL